MNVIKKMMIAAGTASVALAPIAATAAAPVAQVSARVAPTSADESDLQGRGSGVIIGILAAAAIIAGIVILADDNNDAVSP